jgi:hypothetical protein
MDSGQEPQSLVSVSNISGLNPKSLCNVFDVKAYVVLIATHPSVGDVKTDDPLVLLEKVG